MGWNRAISSGINWVLNVCCHVSKCSLTVKDSSGLGNWYFEPLLLDFGFAALGAGLAWTRMHGPLFYLLTLYGTVWCCSFLQQMKRHWHYVKPVCSIHLNDHQNTVRIYFCRFCCYYVPVIMLWQLTMHQSNAWFPPFRCHSAVAVSPLPLHKSVRITKRRKNYVAYGTWKKSVAPLPFPPAVAP